MMRKWIICLFILLLTTGCNQKETEEILKEVKEYQNIVSMLKEKEITETELPCKIEIQLEKSESDELIYTVTLDEPEEAMYEIQALFISMKEEKNSYPSVGILDDKENLVPDRIDKENGFVKGIVLAGYLSSKEEIDEYHDTFRLYLSYKDEEGEKQVIYYEQKI